MAQVETDGEMVLPKQTASVVAPLVRRRRRACPRAFPLGDGGLAIHGGGTLSRGHLEILECIAAGYTNAEIAAERKIATETVKKHAHNLMRLIGARNRASLASWWTEVSASLDSPRLQGGGTARQSAVRGRMAPDAGRWARRPERGEPTARFSASG